MKNQLLLLAALSLAGCAHTADPTTFGLTTSSNGERILWVNWNTELADSAPTYIVPDADVTAVGVSPEEGGWTLIWGGRDSRHIMTLLAEVEGKLTVLEDVTKVELEGPGVAYKVGEHDHDEASDHSHSTRFAIKDGKNAGSDLLLRPDGSFVLVPADDAAFWDERLGGVPGRGSGR